MSLRLLALPLAFAGAADLVLPQTNSLFIASNVMTGRTWNPATNAGNGNSGSCAVTAGPVQFYSAPFFTDQTASTYRLSLYYPSFQPGYVYLYQDAFVPTDPCRGIIAFGFAPVANLANIHLDANRQYVFVTSENVMSIGGGAFQVSIDGPAGSHLFPGMPQHLTSTIGSISLGSGGAQPWDLDAGPARAQQVYLVMGSVTGTSPGVLLPGNVSLPLNYDWWLGFTAAMPNAAPLSGSLGLLDGVGTAHVGGLVLPPGLPAVLASLTVHHAFVTFDATGAITFVSNPLALRLFP